MSESSDLRMTWTNIYLSFALPRGDRARLDEHLRLQNSSLSMRLRETLAATLADAGVELPVGPPASREEYQH